MSKAQDRATRAAMAEAKSTPTLHQEALMEAMVASCAMVAHSDGTIEDSERRRMLLVMRALPTFAAFSPVEIAAEFDDHERRFREDPVAARAHCEALITAVAPRSKDVSMLLFACQQVMDADGVAHPAEYETLGRVGKALAAD